MRPAPALHGRHRPPCTGVLLPRPASAGLPLLPAREPACRSRGDRLLTGALATCPSIAGVLGLPNSVAWLGWIAGPICVCIAYAVSLWSSQLLVQLYRVDGMEFARYHHLVEHGEGWELSERRAQALCMRRAPVPAHADELHRPPAPLLLPSLQCWAARAASSSRRSRSPRLSSPTWVRLREA